MPYIYFFFPFCLTIIFVVEKFYFPVVDIDAIINDYEYICIILSVVAFILVGVFLLLLQFFLCITLVYFLLVNTICLHAVTFS